MSSEQTEVKRRALRLEDSGAIVSKRGAIYHGSEYQTPTSLIPRRWKLLEQDCTVEQFLERNRLKFCVSWQDMSPAIVMESVPTDSLEVSFIAAVFIPHYAKKQVKEVCGIPIPTD